VTERTAAFVAMHSARLRFWRPRRIRSSGSASVRSASRREQRAGPSPSAAAALSWPGFVARSPARRARRPMPACDRMSRAARWIRGRIAAVTQDVDFQIGGDDTARTFMFGESDRHAQQSPGAPVSWCFRPRCTGRSAPRKAAARRALSASSVAAEQRQPGTHRCQTGRGRGGGESTGGGGGGSGRGSGCPRVGGARANSSRACGKFVGECSG
jgi:hypothetical protein